MTLPVDAKYKERIVELTVEAKLLNLTPTPYPTIIRNSKEHTLSAGTQAILHQDWIRKNRLLVARKAAEEYYSEHAKITGILELAMERRDTDGPVFFAPILEGEPKLNLASISVSLCQLKIETADGSSDWKGSLVVSEVPDGDCSMFFE